MRIVHVEMPRHFTLSVNEYMTEAAALLEANGHAFEQNDLNPNFWKWLLGLSTPRSPRDLFEPLLNVGGTGTREADFWALLTELRGHLHDVSRHYGMQVDVRGIRLPRDVTNSSYAMCTLVADNYGVGLFSNFFQSLEERLHLRDAGVISFGIESPEAIFWALQLASWLRTAGCAAHFCIGRHAWENFSLLPHIDDLAKNPWFFGLIDSVILYQENLPETLGALAGWVHRAEARCHGPAHEPPGLQNIAIKWNDAVHVLRPEPSERVELRVAEPIYKIPARYFEAMDVPRDHLVYGMAMVRNKCFYKKCTFCVQIAKHISDKAYAEPAEIQRALAAIEELQRHGITMINFMDEAMRPVDLRDFCTGMKTRGLSMRWVGRMIAAANPSREILAMMKEAGCTEILFGLETFNPALSADMGKVSKSHDGAPETTAMIEAFLDAGLFVILSMIYQFPTEEPAARRQTLASVERLHSRADRFAMIFNRFHLLHESAIYKEPARFNIRSVEPRLPENDLQYHFEYQCEQAFAETTADEQATMHRLTLGLCPQDYEAALRAHGKDLLDLAYFLDYISVGFRHRATRDTTLLATILA